MEEVWSNQKKDKIKWSLLFGAPRFRAENRLDSAPTVCLGEAMKTQIYSESQGHRRSRREGDPEAQSVPLGSGLSVSSGSCLQSKCRWRVQMEVCPVLGGRVGGFYGAISQAGRRVVPPGDVEEDIVYRWAGSLPGRVMLPRWRTGSGWASVLKTQLSKGIRSSLENNRYRYLGRGGRRNE